TRPHPSSACYWAHGQLCVQQAVLTVLVVPGPALTARSISANLASNLSTSALNFSVGSSAITFTSFSSCRLFLYEAHRPGLGRTSVKLAKPFKLDSKPYSSQL